MKKSEAFYENFQGGCKLPPCDIFLFVRMQLMQQILLYVGNMLTKMIAIGIFNR